MLDMIPDKYKTLIVNLSLALLAACGGVFLYATQEDVPFRIDWAAAAAAAWTALRGLVGWFVAWRTGKPLR